MNTQFKNLKNLGDKVDACTRCGFCTYYCPIYHETREEGNVSRGKVTLVQETLKGNLELNGDLLEKLQTCLLCKTCSVNCPSGVELDKIIVSARADYVNNKGLPLLERIVFRYILPRRKLFGWLLRLVARMQRVLPRSDRSGMIRHLPEFARGLGRGRNVPRISNRFLRDRLPSVIHPPRGVPVRGRVCFFAGCGMDYVYPQDGLDSVHLLNRLGIEVVFPHDQGCCGAAVMLNGDFVTARKMALETARVFESCDTVLTGCATCGATLKGYRTYLGDTAATQYRLDRLGDKVKDINEYIIDVLGMPGQTFQVRPEFKGMRITWHDPCHLGRYQGIWEQPRRILKALPNVEFVEMPDADRCCGMGGSFSITHYGLSQQIAQKKADGIRASGADLVVTDCPGCLVQLNDIMLKNGLPQQAIHIAHLLA